MWSSRLWKLIILLWHSDLLPFQNSIYWNARELALSKLASEAVFWRGNQRQLCKCIWFLSLKIRVTNAVVGSVPDPNSSAIHRFILHPSAVLLWALFTHSPFCNPCRQKFFLALRFRSAVCLLEILMFALLLHFSFILFWDFSILLWIFHVTGLITTIASTFIL